MLRRWAEGPSGLDEPQRKPEGSIFSKRGYNGLGAHRETMPAFVEHCHEPGTRKHLHICYANSAGTQVPSSCPLHSEDSETHRSNGHSKTIQPAVTDPKATRTVPALLSHEGQERQRDKRPQRVEFKSTGQVTV